MSDDDHRGLEDVLRDIANEVTASLERISEIDIDALARSAGLDPERGREWLSDAQQWLRQSAPSAWHATQHTASDTPDTHTPPTDTSDPWQPAGPHPLDVPTATQGAALAALDSGRWTLEPGTSALTVVGGGPGPSDALGLVRALRVRDWLRADGTVTTTGRHALERWLATTT